MKIYKKTSKSGNPARIPLSKPGMSSLFALFARAALTGGMLWLVFFAGMVATYLHVNHFPVEKLLVLLIAAVVVIAFVRAIREWQHELDEYQRDLTEYRMNMADIRNKQQVKKDIIWDRH
jgi:membrane protein implicated in regulation of membrane protease activity